MNVLRWLLVIASPAAALACAFGAALLLISLLKWFCPAALMISGMCTAPWYAPAEVAALSIAALVGGALFVYLPARLAPIRAESVAWVAIGAGCAYATAFLWQGGASLVVPFVAAGAGGALAIRQVRRQAAKPR